MLPEGYKTIRHGEKSGRLLAAEYFLFSVIKFNRYIPKAQIKDIII